MTAVKKQPVGPVDVMKILTDIKAGKVTARTAKVEICIDPNVAEQANALYDQIEKLRATIKREAVVEKAISEITGDDATELAALEAEHDELFERYQASLVTFEFRSQNIGDRQHIVNAMAHDNVDIEDPEASAPYGTAQYMVGPTTMTPDDVRRLITVIGWPQFNKLCDCWQTLVFGGPQAPLSRRPSRGPETVKS